jgi:hypothetical protein
MRFPRTAVVVFAGAILLTACGGGESADSATTLAPTETTGASPATTPSKTPITTEPTFTTKGTSTADASTTTLAAEVLVAQVHSRVLTELLAGDERVVGPEGQLGLAEELTTGILLGRIRTVAVGRMASGSRSVGGFDSNIVKVIVTGDSASVSDCSRDVGEIYSASGELLKPVGEDFALIRSRLVLINGAWKVRDIYTGGSHPCDPAEVSTQATRVSTTTVEAMTSSKATSNTEVTATTSAAEALVAQVHTRVFTEVFAGDDRVDDPESRLPLAEELTTGVLLERLREVAAEDLASGERSVGGYESNIARVVVTGDSATVLDCSRDAAEGYSSSGELTIPADDFFKFRQSVLVLIDGAWFVEGVYTGGDERCDPADYR